MSIDSFIGFDSADGGISPEQVREYQARMARNAKHMAAARKQEKKQKKKEDRLFLILLKFIRDNKRNDITLLVSRCLEQNIPAVFILAILMLDNEELQKEFGIQFELLEGPESASEQDDLPDPPPQLESPKNTTPSPNALVAFGENNTFPLEMRIALDLWTKNIWDAVSPIPERIFKTAVEFNEDPKAEPEAKEVVIQLTAFILRDYFTDHGSEQLFDNIKSFADFFLKGLLKRLKEQMKDQIQLEGEEY
jgi:hypothetical protein